MMFWYNLIRHSSLIKTIEKEATLFSSFCDTQREVKIGVHWKMKRRKLRERESEWRRRRIKCSKLSTWAWYWRCRRRRIHPVWQCQWLMLVTFVADLVIVPENDRLIAFQDIEKSRWRRFAGPVSRLVGGHVCVCVGEERGWCKRKKRRRWTERLHKLTDSNFERGYCSCFG